MQSLL
jgi:glgA: glycogen/starch synthases, ADP-glucose type